MIFLLYSGVMSDLTFQNIITSTADHTFYDEVSNYSLRPPLASLPGVVFEIDDGFFFLPWQLLFEQWGSLQTETDYL